MIFILVALLTVIVIFIKQKLRVYETWKLKKISHLKGKPLVGNFSDVLLRKKSSWQLMQEEYKKFPNDRYYGMYVFFTPLLVIKDPELIKQITIKDFEHFGEHGTLVDEDFDKVWSNNLFAMNAKKWKHMRPTLSPAFTSNKMKFMYQFMQQASGKMINHLSTQQENDIPVELKDLFSKFSADVIATTAFGLDCNNMQSEDNEFYKNGKKVTDFSGIRRARLFIHKLSPTLQRILNWKMIDDEQKNFFSQVILDTLKHRRENGLVRTDMIHLLLEAQKKSNDSEFKITDDDIISQALVFYLAGHDTTSTLMTLTGYELMMNPDVQERLIQEIDEAYQHCENGKIAYEDILKMKYLDMVLSETLRKWPPIPIYDRKCLKTYTIPTKNGEPELTIEKDMADIWIPAYSIHRDSKYFPNPDKFDPERFSDENKININPSTLLGFGSGPKSCIGSRFALLENKVIFTNLLRRFRFVPTKDSPINPQWDPTNFSYYPIGGFKMALRKRTT